MFYSPTFFLLKIPRVAKRDEKWYFKQGESENEKSKRVIMQANLCSLMYSFHLSRSPRHIAAQLKHC